MNKNKHEYTNKHTDNIRVNDVFSREGMTSFVDLILKQHFSITPPTTNSNRDSKLVCLLYLCLFVCVC